METPPSPLSSSRAKPRDLQFRGPFLEMFFFVPAEDQGVAHISLVFSEMWDTTALNLFIN